MVRRASCCFCKAFLVIAAFTVCSLVRLYHTAIQQQRKSLSELHKRHVPSAPYTSKPRQPELLFTMHTELYNLKLRFLGQALGKTEQDELQARASFLINTIEQIGELRESMHRVEVDKLSESIQKRLFQLQNPTQCETAKKMICVLDNWYGFGGMVHHMTACYHIGLAFERTVMFHYTVGNFYKPVLNAGTKCTFDEEEVAKLAIWDGEQESPDTLVAYKIPHKITGPTIFPTDALPQDVAPRIQSFHGLPVAWWQGQIVKYIAGPTDELLAEIARVERKIQFYMPILGMHVRRTDKHVRYTHADGEYMKVAKLWFDIYDQKLALEGQKPLKRRRIFLATESITTVKALRERYPGFEFINNINATALSEQTDKRVEKETMLGLLVDIHILSKCSHLVCDGNSNVCRLSYEIMQTKFVDASTRFTPVGLVYHNFPYPNKFHYDLDFTQQAGEVFETKTHSIDYKTIHLDFRYHASRVTNVVPVNVL